MIAAISRFPFSLRCAKNSVSKRTGGVGGKIVGLFMWSLPVAFCYFESSTGAIWRRCGEIVSEVVAFWRDGLASLRAGCVDGWQIRQGEKMGYRQNKMDGSQSKLWGWCERALARCLSI